jgi:hypothetical protein
MSMSADYARHPLPQRILSVPHNPHPISPDSVALIQGCVDRSSILDPAESLIFGRLYAPKGNTIPPIANFYTIAGCAATTTLLRALLLNAFLFKALPQGRGHSQQDLQYCPLGSADNMLFLLLYVKSTPMYHTPNSLQINLTVVYFS